ncbi:hypothetical protein [Streptomyces sp. NPDC003374]
MVLLTAHRLSTVTSADHLVPLAHGKVRDRGRRATNCWTGTSCTGICPPPNRAPRAPMSRAAHL